MSDTNPYDLGDVALVRRFRNRMPSVNDVTAVPIDASLISLSCIAVCPACGEFANLDFRGIQEIEDGVPGFSVWNCRSCGSTVSGSRILPAETESALLAVPHMGRDPQ